MAGDWIKFEVATPDKPEVWAIAADLKIDPDAVVGKLLRVWAWFDQHTENGNAMSVTKSLLDRLVGVTGFCNCVVAVGWLLDDGKNLSIAKFDRHNGETAKTRGLTAKRVAKSRGKGNAESNGASVTPPLPKEDTDTDKKNKPSPAEKFSEDDKNLAVFIFDKIKAVSPHSKLPNFSKWADTIRLMRERDGLTHDVISEVFAWANADDFWKAIILSVENLRDNFVKLSAKKEAQKSGQRNQHSRPSKSQSDEQALRDYHAELAAQEAALLGVAGVIEPPLGVSPGRQH